MIPSIIRPELAGSGTGSMIVVWAEKFVTFESVTSNAKPSVKLAVKSGTSGVELLNIENANVLAPSAGLDIPVITSMNESEFPYVNGWK